MAINPDRAKHLFFAAADIADADARAAFLDRESAGDTNLRARVEALLKAHAEPDETLDAHAQRIGTADYPPISEKPGSRIGPYKLMEQIGEGGFGLVFVAEQTEPVKRKVALKVIKPGMDSREVMARFAAERQALALMDHPNIARVLDAGATNSGRPYFVMELVRGIPITDYCDQNQLLPRDRLDLFITVCQAVQHAHQKGIIHRDIKPSNVLVTSHDGKPVAKVIDFGVAKAISQQLSDRSIYTSFAQMIGTPLYMSPEQAEMSGLDIDTRSDIYSLGVLLYELLTGTTPLDKKRFAKAAYDEIRRMIREDEPQKPSTRLSTSESIASVAAQRDTEPDKLSKLMRGDLDWITMKCLEKDRTRRYETANGLARDIQRYLSDEPVEACPPSATYRLRKFAKKNRTMLSTVASIAFLLLAGAAVSTWQAVRATNAEMAARQSAADAVAAQRAEADQRRLAETSVAAEKKAKEEAQAREAETKAVLDFVQTKIFAAARPKDQDGGMGYDVPLADALKAAMRHVDTSFATQPLIEAALRMTLGKSYMYLGKPDVAEVQFRRARELYTATLGPDHPDTLNSMSGLASSISNLGRLPEALALREETLKRRKATLGLDHPDTLASMNNLAISYDGLGRFAEALVLFEDTHKLYKARFGPDHPHTLWSMNNLANCYEACGRHREALTLNEEAFALSKAKLGPDHPDTLMSMNSLANSYENLGRHPEALALREETLKLKKAKLGPDHPGTLMSMGSLASSYTHLGRYAEALALQEETLKLHTTKLGPDHPNTIISMANLAESYAALGRHAEALALREETLKQHRTKLGPDHPNTFTSMNNLANSYTALGRHPEALALREETLNLRKAKLGPDHRDTLASMSDLAESYRSLSRDSEALALHEETLKLRKLKLGPDDPSILSSMNYVASSYHSIGRYADALALFEELLKLQKAKLAPDHPGTLTTLFNIGNCYLSLGRSAEALALYEEVLNLQKAKLGPDHPDSLGTLYNLASTYSRLGRHDEALPLNEQVFKLRRVKLGPDHPATLAAQTNLAVCYGRLKRHADALPLLEDSFQRKLKVLPANHAYLYAAASSLAHCYFELDRGADASATADRYLNHVAGKEGVSPKWVTSLLWYRNQYFIKTNNTAGCRATVEMVEKLNLTDADSMYNVACFRAKCAALMREKMETDSDEHADRAMTWLTKAVAAGYKDAAHMKKDTDLDSLRDREDFKKLVAELETQVKK